MPSAERARVAPGKVRPLISQQNVEMAHAECRAEMRKSGAAGIVCPWFSIQSAYALNSLVAGQNYNLV